MDWVHNNHPTNIGGSSPEHLTDKEEAQKELDDITKAQKKDEAEMKKAEFPDPPKTDEKEAESSKDEDCEVEEKVTNSKKPVAGVAEDV